MKAGDLVKRRGKDWHAIVLGFRTELQVAGQLPECDTNYPIIMWTDGQGIDSCWCGLLEVVNEAR